MLTMMASNGGNDVPETDVDEPDGTDAVLVPNDDDADDDVDRGNEVTCDSEAIVRLAACDPISSNFKCSIQIDK